MRVLWVSLFTVAFGVHLSLAQTEPPVTTLAHGGQVRGERTEVTLDSDIVNVDVYNGIPFANPPLGALRFAPPEKHPGWSGVKEATTRPPSCWQSIGGGFDQANAGARIWLNNTEMNEDCLYLNVWTPSSVPSTGSLATMIWIYGGGFTSGTSTLELYDGSVLAAKENVIIVSMQYRLGAFGFLRLNPEKSLRTASVALGNQGLQDQLMALEWVNENIAAFGGDPNKVTVFGYSTGAASASLLWRSPLAKPYFQRVILQSGSMFARYAVDTLEEAHLRGKQFAEGAGCISSANEDRDATIKCLQEMDPLVLVNSLESIAKMVEERRKEKLVKLFAEGNPSAEPEVWSSWASSASPYLDIPLKPVVDGQLITSLPKESFNPETDFRTEPEVLLGTTLNEAMRLIPNSFNLGNETFLQPNGTVIIPREIKLAAERLPKEPNGELADFHRIIAAKVLSEDLLIRGVSKLPTFTYGLPMDTGNTSGYADPYEVKMTSEKLLNRLDNLTTALDFLCPVMDFAEYVAKIPNSKVFVYKFSRRTESLPYPPWVGVMHGYEVEYVFGKPRSEEFAKSFYPHNEEERKLSDQVMRMWANFAKRGDPNVNDDGSTMPTTWPQFLAATDRDPKADGGDHLVIDSTMRTERNLRIDGCRFWNHQVPSQLNILTSRKQG